jgi:hypothetical protein
MTTMIKVLSGSIALFALISFANAACAAEQIPASARKIVMERAETGYRWKLIEAPVPQPGDGQVLVRVRAVGLNRGDWEMLGFDNKNGAFVGRIPSSDAAGDVVAVGKGVQGFRPGMRVTSLYFRNWTDGTASKEILNAAHGIDVDGVLAEYVVLQETAIVAAPKSLSYEEAATLPTAGLTAWNATAGKNELRDRIVLVQGTGGVSIFALQFANAAKARVIATSSSDDKLARVRELGARDERAGDGADERPWRRPGRRCRRQGNARAVREEPRLRRHAIDRRRFVGLRRHDLLARSAEQDRQRARRVRRLAGRLSAHERVHRSASAASGDRQGISARSVRRSLAAPAHRQSCWARGLEAVSATA